jgi:hypothetical protein
MPTTLQKIEQDKNEKASKKGLELSMDESKEDSTMSHSSQELNEGRNQPVTASETPKNLMDDEDFIDISNSVDEQLDAEAQPLIDEINKYLSTLSGQTKTDHATYILKELQGLQFDSSCNTPHDPAVYERVANQIEQYANPKFAAALKTKFGLFTESDEATILPKIFKGSFPTLLKKSITVEKKQEDSSNPEPTNPRSTR